VDQAYRNSPALAAPWSVALADEKQRNNSIEKVFRQWKRSDANAANAWLVTTPLPADRQQKLLGN
ncbi:MAG: hypothetical protein RLZZ350_1718, partial [Verrucomicrobiota bacterium]